MKPWPYWRAAARCAALLAAPSGLVACISYQPAPMAPREIARVYASRTLDPSATAAALTRLAPTAQWNGESWDRLSFLAAAMTSSPAIAEARARAASSDAAALAAKVGPPLMLTLTAEYARNAPESSPWLYGVTADIPLDLGTRRDSRIDSARLAALATHYDYLDAVWTTRMAIRRALAEILLAAREIEIGKSLGEIRQRQLTALDRRVAAGESPRADLDRVRADAAGDSRRIADAEARRLAALTALAEAIGISPVETGKAALAWADFEAPSETGIDIESVRETALLGRADVLRAMAEYDQAEADLQGEVARQWPEFHIGPGYTWERGLVKLPLSVGLSLPPLDLNHSSIAVAEAKRTEAGVRLEGVIARGQVAIDAALIERAAAHSALAHLRTVDLQVANRIAAQADEELARGAIDRVDWASAQAAVRLAQLAEIDALRRVHGADAALEDALRRPLDGPEMLIAPKALGDQS